MNLTDLDFQELSQQVDLQGFDCDDKDINEFLKEDSWYYQRERLANTYLFLNDQKIIAFFCISNDCLNDLGEQKGFKNNIWNRIHRKSKIPNAKRFRSYPAIKVGRLGVIKELHGSGIAYELMDFIKGFSLTTHKPACRFILLDAYNRPKQINYYTNNKFEFLLDDDQNESHRIMYFDLKKFD